MQSDLMNELNEKEQDLENKQKALVFARLFQAYMESSTKIQKSVIQMIEIVKDPKADNQERDMALSTIEEALFPKAYNHPLTDLKESEALGASVSPEMKATLEEMDREEAAFSQRLEMIMNRRGITQCELAQKVGIGQPAIANMLARECRPQRRTVMKLAEALDVEPADLWPPFEQK